MRTEAGSRLATLLAPPSIFASVGMASADFIVQHPSATVYRSITNAAASSPPISLNSGSSLGLGVFVDGRGSGVLEETELTGFSISGGPVAPADLLLPRTGLAASSPISPPDARPETIDVPVKFDEPAYLRSLPTGGSADFIVPG
jgi:hypothetical protein